MNDQAAPAGNHATEQTPNDASVNKGKGKEVDKDESMEVEEGEEEDDEEDSDEEEEEEEEEEAEDYQEIDPSAILAPGARRSTRGTKVDYTSPEALAKAGLAAEPAHGEDDTDGDVSMRED